MRIGIDIRQLRGNRSTGIGRYLRNFISYGASARPEHTFFLYGNQNTATTLAADNIFVRVAAETVTLWWDQVVLASLARADGVDVFLSPYIKGPGRVECPLITTIHDLMFLVFPEYSKGLQSLRNAVFKQMALWVSRRASVILTASDHASRDIQTLLGVDRQKIRVVPHGVDETFRPVTDEVRVQSVCSRYGIERPYVYYLGNFKPHKNVQSLLRAFACLPSGLQAKYELVLGGGADRWLPDCSRQAGELGVESSTRFIGHVADEDMAALYSGAELFVFPSLYEGFGLPPLEAMACGTAVVASNRTSIPEVVGDAGSLVDPEDVASLSAEMARVLQDGEARLRFEEKGLARAESFRTTDICERQMGILEQVVSGEGP